VALTNLAGRTLAALITGKDTETGTDEARLCWVGPPGRGWEPEPLRSLEVGLMARLADSADRHEDMTGRPARLRAAIVDGMLG